MDVQELRHLIRDVTKGEETAFDVVNTIVGEGDEATPKTELVIRQRRLNPEAPELPVKQRSPKRDHTVFNIDGFAAYLRKFGSDNTVVLADPVHERMGAVLDERAGDGFEGIVFTPALHPLFIPWRDALLARPIPLREFARLLARNRRAIVAPDGRDLVLTLSQIKVSKKIELCHGTGPESVNGMMVETKIAGQVRSEEVKLPETLTIRTPLFVDTTERDLEVDLMLSEAEGTVYVELASTDIEVARVEVFDEMLKDLAGQLTEDKFTLAMGEVKYADWRTLEPLAHS